LIVWEGNISEINAVGTTIVVRLLVLIFEEVRLLRDLNNK